LVCFVQFLKESQPEKQQTKIGLRSKIAWYLPVIRK